MFQIYAGNSLVYEPGDMNLVLLAPKLTLEMGKAGSLEFTVPAGHPYMSDLKQLTKPVSVDLDGEKIFRGRILSGTRTFYNQREVYCEGVLSYLVDSVQKAEKYDGKTHALFRKIIANHNARMPAEKQFTVGNITVTDQDIHLLGQSDDISAYDYSQIAINSIVDNWNTTYDCIETCLISYCGGYLMVRNSNGTNYIDWVSDYTSTATQEITFGENLLDLTDESTAEDVFTVLIPIGDDNLTVKTVNNNSDEIVDAAKVAKYGRIIRTNVFASVTNPQTLLENGRRYLANNGDVPTTLTLTAVDLHNVYPEIKAIRLGDRVYIRSDPHDLSQYLTCTKIEYDLERPENTVYTFGREKQSLTQRYREDKRVQNDPYGNDASYGGGSYYGGVGGAIGSAASADAKEETTWSLQRTYNDINNKLKNTVGIDLDAERDSINIYSIATSTNSNATAIANIETWAGRDQDGNLGSRIALKTQVNDVDDKVASIILYAGGDVSNIALDADVVSVSNRLEAVEAVFDNLTVSDWARFKRLIYSPKVYAGGFYVDDGTEESGTLNLATHYHRIYVDSNNKLYLGTPTSSQDHTDIGISIKPVFGA